MNHKTWLLQHGYFKNHIGENVLELIEVLEDQGLTKKEQLKVVAVFVKVMLKFQSL
jgi:hypothetical protein